MADLRAEQILDAIVTNLTGGLSETVYRDRLNPHLVPSVSVAMGPDDPTEEYGASNLAFIDSVLTVYVDCFVKTSAVNITQALNAIRKSVHVQMMESYTQGLGFVINTRPGGAEPPDLDQAGETPAGSLRTVWEIHYRTSLIDASA